MNVRFTQIVDFWIGVPLCVIFSFVHLLQKMLRPRSMNRPQKILFIEISEMGSAIIAYSSLVRAREFLKSDELYFLVFEKNRESVELLNIIPRLNIITIPDSSFSVFVPGVLRALLKVRAIGIDTIVDLELFSRFSALFSFASGASNRVGFHNYTAEGLYRGSFITHRVFYNAHQHMAGNFLALVHALEAPEAETPMLKLDVRESLLPLPEFQVSDDLLRSVRALVEDGKPLPDGARLVVINPDPGEALPIRGWPLERFVEVAKVLTRADSSIMLVVIGLQRSKPYADAICAGVPEGRCVDLTGKTRTLEEVVALLKMSEVLLGNDSGPAHFAALTKVKIVTLFGPETPALYGPLSPNAVNIFSGFACAPCLSAANHRYSICGDSKCLKAVTSDSVAFKILDLLGLSSRVSM